MGSDQVILYAVPWCHRCHRLRTFFAAAAIPYRELDPEQERDAAARLGAETDGSVEVPAVQVGERLLLDPDDATLADALGVPIPEGLDLYDVIILGGGPAGLTAAIYTARERLRTLVIDRGLTGGQAAVTGQIENYPGFPDPVGGAELMERVHRQAERFGTEIHTFEEVLGVELEEGVYLVRTASAGYRARSIIVATGSVYRRIGVPGEEELIGRGVSFCATCDAPFFRDKHVIVVGGGNSALQETVHLAEFASQITIIQLLDHFTGTKILTQRVQAMAKVDVLFSHRITRIVGEGGVEAVELEDLAGGGSRRIECEGVFVFIGLQPNTRFLRGTVDLDPGGFVATSPNTLATSVPGVFAAGDLRSGSAKQITAAVGEGTVAAFMIQNWLEKKHRERP